MPGVERRKSNPVRALLSRFACVIAACALLALHEPAAAADRGSVANATFTSRVADGAPIDFRQQFDNNTQVVYYYTEILGLQGQSVTHRWKFQGKVVQEVKLPVKGSRQGVWSRNKMPPERTGNWTVEVVDPRGEVIRMDNFAYNPPL